MKTLFTFSIVLLFSSYFIQNSFCRESRKEKKEKEKRKKRIYSLPQSLPLNLEVSLNELSQKIPISLNAVTNSNRHTLVFLIRTPPKYGKLSNIVHNKDKLKGHKAKVFYTPHNLENFSSDSFTYSVRYKGGIISAPSKVNIKLTKETILLQFEDEINFGNVPILSFLENNTNKTITKNLKIKNLSNSKVDLFLQVQAPFSVFKNSTQRYVYLYPKQITTIPVSLNLSEVNQPDNINRLIIFYKQLNDQILIKPLNDNSKKITQFLDKKIVSINANAIKPFSINNKSLIIKQKNSNSVTLNKLNNNFQDNIFTLKNNTDYSIKIKIHQEPNRFKNLIFINNFSLDPKAEKKISVNWLQDESDNEFNFSNHHSTALVISAGKYRQKINLLMKKNEGLILLSDDFQNKQINFKDQSDDPTKLTKKLLIKNKSQKKQKILLKINEPFFIKFNKILYTNFEYEILPQKTLLLNIGVNPLKLNKIAPTDKNNHDNVVNKKLTFVSKSLNKTWLLNFEKPTLDSKKSNLKPKENKSTFSKSLKKINKKNHLLISKNNNQKDQSIFGESSNDQIINILGHFPGKRTIISIIPTVKDCRHHSTTNQTLIKIINPINPEIKNYNQLKNYKDKIEYELKFKKSKYSKKTNKIIHYWLPPQELGIKSSIEKNPDSNFTIFKLTNLNPKNHYTFCIFSKIKINKNNKSQYFYSKPTNGIIFSVPEKKQIKWKLYLLIILITIIFIFYAQQNNLVYKFYNFLHNNYSEKILKKYKK